MPEWAREALHADYNSMVQDGILLVDAPEFNIVLEQCASLEAEINSRYGK